MYVYCVVCYLVIAPYVISVGHVFAYLYTIDDDSERSMDYEILYSLKFFLYNSPFDNDYDCLIINSPLMIVITL